MNATLTFLGTGTSMGVPTLGCGCAVCTSAVTPPPAGDPRNRRTRPSVHIAWHSEGADHAVLIDTGPDFHAQAIRERVTHVDAVFYTHPHADHILGLDDLRPLTFALVDPLPLYVDEQTAAVIERIFDYTFRPPTRGTTIARVALNRLKENEAIHLFGASFQRIPVNHGNLVISGYRFGSAAYLTDMSSIPEASMAQLQNLDILILDALRITPHPTHSNVENSLRIVEQLKPKRAFFTHMGHDLDHATTDATLPPHVRLAYDGLKLGFDLKSEPSA
ncbi:phosphoribosyl 1,2-cyclic phosphate phosphodiesterase [Granulicella aggregans]|uniref:Phosphoribosyl 1,2-cyclic phosphate phosphodiesterase n=1 Tax=Granulicella aggregans TaxID=474949 RepID=A0A7W7Z9W5_9BACT|nr:MBL fold metallo-hydrolase [Granulicella aggregans]MBB5055903.1 phosphoribosyl 1,2-cyclic phosphate phosphodiesterase [Granulicella aggregans]